jgi:hypothetical protein
VTWTQIVGAGVATAVAAVAASFLGVYGTVIGAALMSVISTGGTVLVQRGLNRTNDQVQRAGQKLQTQIRPRQPTNTTGRHRLTPSPAPSTGPTTPDPAAQDPGSGSTAADPGSAQGDGDGTSDGEGGDGRRRLPRWAVWAISAVAVFAVVMGIVTVVELAIHKPLSSVVRGEPGSGTTFGRHQQSTPTPNATSSPGRSPGRSPAHTPSTGKSGGSSAEPSGNGGNSPSAKPTSSTNKPTPNDSRKASAEPSPPAP